MVSVLVAYFSCTGTTEGIAEDIADITGLDVSTVSRVSNSKYVQTWFGIYALKDFFSGSMQTTDGEEVSTGELKMR